MSDHSHCHDHQESAHCCCSSHKCCCHLKSECKEGECSDENFSKKLLQLADEAWMEVLKEKIKEQIKTSSNKNLDELAKLVSEANEMRWRNKMNSKNACHSFTEKIAKFFGCEGSCK